MNDQRKYERISDKYIIFQNNSHFSVRSSFLNALSTHKIMVGTTSFKYTNCYSVVGKRMC